MASFPFSDPFSISPKEFQKDRNMGNRISSYRRYRKCSWSFQGDISFVRSVNSYRKEKTQLNTDLVETCERYKRLLEKDLFLYDLFLKSVIITADHINRNVFYPRQKYYISLPRPWGMTRDYFRYVYSELFITEIKNRIYNQFIVKVSKRMGWRSWIEVNA